MSLCSEIAGIGIDIISRPRIERFLNEHFSTDLSRLLSPLEFHSLQKGPDRNQLFARYFTAKEAYFKACSGVWMEREEFRKIEVQLEANGEFRIAGDPGARGRFFETPDGLGAEVIVWKGDAGRELDLA